MISNGKPSSNDGIRISNTILDTALGRPEDSMRLPTATIEAELKEAGINLTSSWTGVQQMITLAKKRSALATARRERLAQANADLARTGANESRESLIVQIRRMISLQGSAVYARKWEDCSVSDLTSLRDALMTTAAREAARKHASG